MTWHFLRCGSRLKSGHLCHNPGRLLFSVCRTECCTGYSRDSQYLFGPSLELNDLLS
jgi:hypothetical protein